MVAFIAIIKQFVRGTYIMMTMMRTVVRSLFLIIVLRKLIRILRRFHIFKRIEFLKSVFSLLGNMRSSIPRVMVMGFFFLETLLRRGVIATHMIACFKAMITTAATAISLLKMTFFFFFTFSSIGFPSLWIGLTAECLNILLE